RKDLRQVTRSPKLLTPSLSLQPSEIEDVIAFLLADPSRQSPLPSQTSSKSEPTPDLNVSFARIKHSMQEPHNWLTHWGDYRGTHYSGLRSITPANVSSLKSQWTFHYGASNVIEATPIVVDGLMFVTGPFNDAVALDARTGREIWRYKRRLPEGIHQPCTVMTNRGFAILGDRLYMGTLDTHLVALDAKTGNPIWDVSVDDYQKGYSITHAPLAIDGKIIVGVTSGE